MNIKQQSIFSQLIKNILIPIVIVLITLSILYINYNYQVRTSFNEQKKLILIEELKTLIQFQDIALAMVEEQLTEEMKDFSHELVYNEFKNTTNIANTNLASLTEKYNSQSDIYIVDTTGEIINTTFKKDLGFNLFNINEEHKRFLLNVFSSNEFISERLSLELSTGKQKKYTYQSTLDNNYIVELGAYSPKATGIINSMNLGIQMLTQNIQLNIVSVDLFIGIDNKKSFNSESYIDEDHIGIFEEVFITKQQHDTIVELNDKILLYDYVYFKRNETNLYSGSLIRIVLDITDDQSYLINELIIFSLILSITISFLFFLFYKRARSITLPITNLEKQVKLIESGDLSKRATVKGNNEITSLSIHFNSMIDKLEGLYQNLEMKVKERTIQLEKKQNDIESSIRYAQHIQAAVLPPDGRIIKSLPNSFIFYKPKDIVSGDFYWMAEKENKIIIAAVDCTGHGVPGGFMSMLGIAFLNEIVNKTVLNKHVYNLQADDILNQLRAKVIEALNQTGQKNESKDGMDISLCIIDFEDQSLQFSGANNPLCLVRNSELTVIKGDRKSISYDRKVDIPFENNTIDFEPGDMIYLFSDGYQDQFGGEKDRKFSVKKFKELLRSIAHESISTQKYILDNTLNNWQGNNSQTDDILVIGVKLDHKKEDTDNELDWSNKTILIVEDIEINYILLVEVLIGTNVNILKATDGLQAVETCKNNEHIDLILMDINLPNIDGFEATRRIKHFRPNIPIIAQTAFDMPEIAIESKMAGCSDYFTKPIKFDKFINTLRKYLE